MVHVDALLPHLLPGLVDARLAGVEPFDHALERQRRRLDLGVEIAANHPVAFPVLEHEGLARALVLRQQVLGQFIELPLLIPLLLLGDAVSPVAIVAAQRGDDHDVRGERLTEQIA